MDSIQERIPNFNTWKMFNETIVPALLNMESSESTLEKLSEIVKSGEFSKFFVCNHDLTISFEEHQELSKNYKAFTVWLLGRFYYLLNCSKISRKHDLIVEAQWRILYELSIRQPNIYEELASEYVLALKALNLLHKNSTYDSTKLELFVSSPPINLSRKLNLSPISIDILSPSSCHNMQLKTVTLIEKIILNNIKLGWLNDVTNESLDCLLYILIECDINLKLTVLQVFVKILQREEILYSLTPAIKQKVFKCASLLNQVVFLAYNKQIELDFVKLENILLALFSLKNLDKSFVEVAYFLASQQGINLSLQNAVYKHLQRKQTTENLVIEDCVEAIFKKQHLNQLIEINIFFEITTYISANFVNSELLVQNSFVSKTWNKLNEAIELAFRSHICSASSCQIEVNLWCLSQVLSSLCRIKIKVQNYLIEEKSSASVKLMFFSEVDILNQLLKLLKSHFENCSEKCLNENLTTSFLNILVTLPTTYVGTDIEFIFNCLAQGFLNAPELICRTALSGSQEFVDIAKGFSYYVNKMSFQKEVTIKLLSRFMRKLSVGLININNSKVVEKIGGIFYKIVKNMVNETNFESVELEVFQALVCFPTVLTNTDNWIKELLIPLLKMNLADSLLVALIEAVSDIICKSKSKFIQAVSWNLEESDISVKLFCLTCEDEMDQNMNRLLERLQVSNTNASVAIFQTFQPLGGENFVHEELLQQIFKCFNRNTLVIRKSLLKALKSFSHIPMLITSSSDIKIWMTFAADDDATIRKQFAQTISFVLSKLQDLDSITLQEDLWEVCLIELREYSRDSVQNSKYDLQDTLIKTISSLSKFNVERVTLRVTQLVFFFMLFPTSRYSEIASSIFITMAKEKNSSTKRIFTQYKKELCKIIADVCSVNHAVFKYTLCVSLEKLSLVLGYFGAKNFIVEENKYLTPFFVSKVITSPRLGVEALLNEMATLSELSLSELLVNRYGNIFLHIFLNQSEEDFKKCTNYIERVTGVPEITLLKRNSLLILHELLLNFHNQQERVLAAITMLAQEDLEDVSFNSQQVPGYLQPKFLGVLAYFDMKLSDRFSSKNNILLSLAQLLTLMGPKHITPLRFKILAMLTTSLNTTSEFDAELNCDVWNAFIRSCEIEALGPQLATIFVALLPLVRKVPQKIYNIFKYLVIDNEEFFKDYICDLFFMVDVDVSNEICVVVRKYLECIETLSFKEQLSFFFKYLNHETIDIRIYGLKYVTQLLQKNREKLNQMILGFNGIDPIILELLDILMLICREKEYALKLACGECIGELGAIEPSHLPQKYMGDTMKFIFFITEDGFIVNALNELTRALQAEKNTRSMDRFALAIQEILKVYGISNDSNSKKHSLWISFPEAQREVMLPLLSSLYKMVQPVEGAAASPIYGSKLGGSFHMWITNWISNLILCIDSTKRPLLQVCLPSLKQDHKTLMHFLPHILLHVLLENGDEIHQMVYDEIEAVIRAVLNKQLKPTTPFTCKFASCTPSLKSEEAHEIQCIKIVFVLLDFLNRWIRERTWEKEELKSQDAWSILLRSFLNRFNKLELARCNYQSGEYPRALMYLEEYIETRPNELNNQFPFLAEIYAQLDEPDGVAGVTVLQTTEPSLDQRVLALEVSGKLADAAACYEQMRPPLQICHLQGLLRCYLDLENVNTAWNFAEGAMKIQPGYTNILLEEQAEALWRLSQYNELNSLVNKSELANNNSWNVQLGRSLLHLRNSERDEFKSALNSLRLAQVDALGAASLKEGAYSHGYSCIAKLHAITELQQSEQTIHELLIRPNDHNVSDSIIKKLTSDWDLRLKVVQESVRIQEPILCLRRVAIEQAKTLLANKVPRSLQLLNALLGELWLLSANIARDAGVHHQAYTYTLKAENYAPPRLFLEKAKLQWLKEEREQALATLRRGVEVLLPHNLSNSGSLLNKITFENRKLAAEARLLIASYNDSISNVDAETNIQHYKEAVEVFKEWEKSMVCLGQYYDRLFQTLQDHEKDTKGGDMQVHMVNYFGKSLVYGSKYVYQSMPRMLSIWFDCGTRLLDVPSNDTLLKLTKIIDMYLDRLPAYLFFTAFSQLVSRICHPQKQVYLELKSIIIKLILQYPQQSLWMIMAVRKSSYSIRSKRCDEILNDSRLKTLSMIKLVGDFTKLAEKLIELCNKDLPETMQSASVNNLLRALPRLISKEDFSKIMIPTQKFRKLILPNPDFQSNEHNAFPNHYVHIVGIEDEITILQSLQHPRKITFRGSDGKKYVQMLKPKDDLRKDFRLMEFNDIVNQLLSREADSRQRRLNIRLYSVVPLNEECGLIEWIPNLVGLRPILLSLYKQKGVGLKGRELKQICCNQRDPITKKRDVFTKQLIPKHPPLLGEWFKKNFPDAQGWLTARTAYIRTLAVMSMVGYILGLGDRHGENILFDSTSGDIVHVDFNCLFNKGETFEWPERVPFRLTHNMVAAMGALGVEGPFRKSCSSTLRVLRSHSTTLMSIVTPFVYDPLVSWPRNAASNSAQTSERTNEQAKEHVRNIDLRLQGIIKTRGRSFSIPLSIEGQTNNLIEEAIGIDNLCQMYIGWGAYM